MDDSNNAVHSVEDDKSVLSKIIKMVLINIICYILAYAVNVLISKYTTASQYGRYGLITNSIITVAGFIIFGFDEGAEYFVSLYAGMKKWSKLRGFFIFIVKFFLFLIIPFVAISLLFHATHLLHGDFSSVEKAFATIESAHPMLLFAWVVPLFAIMLVTTPLLSTLNGQLPAQIIAWIIFPLVQLLIIFFCFFVLGRVHIHYTIYAYGIGLLVAVVLQGWSIKKRLPGNVWQVEPQVEQTAWVNYLFPVFLFNLLFYGIDTSVLWLLKFFHDQKAFLGYYTAILAIGNYFMNFAIASLVTIFDIHVAPLWAEKNYPQLQKVVNKAFYILASASLIFCLYVIIFGKKLLANFGASYVYAYPALIIYTVSACLNTATFMWQSLLNYADEVYSLVKSYGIAYAILVLGVASASILHLGFTHIMIGYGLFQFAFFLGNLFFIWKKMRPIRAFPIGAL